MRCVTTVLFDAGFTLIRIHPSLGAIYARAAERLGQPFAADRMQEIGLRVWNECRLPYYLEHPESSDAIERRFWRDYNRLILRELEEDGFHVDFEAWFEALFEDFARPENWAPLAGVVETLETLTAAGYTLAVVSNWDSRLHRVLEGLDLTRHFALVLTSAEAGWRKPSPRIFEQTLAALGAAPEQAIHVGDSEAEDVAGARAARIRVVRYYSGPDVVRSEADHVIATIPELLGLL